MNIYDFKVRDRKGEEFSLEKYKGKVLLIVNTATKCGFTPQYGEMQYLYDTYHKKGLEILDFPCNQFGNQAPGSSEEIYIFCTGNYGITFDQLGKIKVQGEEAEPLFKWLVENTEFKGFNMMHPIGAVLDKVLSAADPDYKKSSSIKWNFTKFLISREGEILARFEPTTSILDIKERIEKAL